MEADCRCPLLLAYAETEKMLELGLQRSGGYASPTAAMIGHLRQEQGCHGPRHGHCPWSVALTLLFGEQVQVRPDVPYVRGRVFTDGRPDPGNLL